MIRDGSTRRQQAQEAAEACVRVLKEPFGVHEVYVFGSLAGQSPWHSRSNIDLAVEGLAPDKYIPTLSTLWELLSEGVELDLITLETAPPELAARIKRPAKGEALMPDDPKAALKVEIADELANLDRLVGRSRVLVQRLPPEPTFIEIDAAGKLVHDFYNGVERIFEHIAVRLGPGLPAGPSWRVQLLRSMESHVEGIRPAVIGHHLALRLVDYLRFRHVFRHTYGYELEWDKLHPLVEKLEDTLTRLRQQINHFIASLEQT